MTDDELMHRRRAGIRALIDSWPTVPAFLSDRYLTVVASNPAACAVSPSFVEGTNLVRFAFTDPGVEHSAPGWSGASDQVTALLRDSLDQHEDDVSFRGLVGELSAVSPEFAESWADERRPDPSGVARFLHPEAGSLDLTYQQLRIPGDYEHTLFVWRASDPRSHQALSRLLSAR